MIKRVTKKLIIAVIAITLLGTTFIVTGCAHRGREMEVDGWTLFRFAHGEQRGQVNILNANCESLVMDGVLHIPARIGRHNIHGFGRTPFNYVGWGPQPIRFGLSANLRVKKIVLASELHIDSLFGWHLVDHGLRYVEFLCTTFERVHSIRWCEKLIYVIPDGATQNFTKRITQIYTAAFLQYNFELINIIEKANFLEEKNNA